MKKIKMSKASGVVASAKAILKDVPGEWPENEKCVAAAVQDDIGIIAEMFEVEGGYVWRVVNPDYEIFESDPQPRVKALAAVTKCANNFNGTRFVGEIMDMP